VAAWTALALLSASQSILTYAYLDSGNVAAGAVLKLMLCLWYTLALLAPAVLWGARRFPLGARTWRWSVPLHMAFMLVFAVVTVGVYRWARVLVGLPSSRAFGLELVNGIQTYVLTYWILVGLEHALAYYSRARDREVKSAALAAELSEARLEALRMQLHPHFLFNTMHAISSAIREDPEGAEDMLAELADLLRATVDRPAAHELPLREELEFIRRYVGIQKVRFGDRLEVVVSVEDDALDALVPALILQPLVENAIEHGIATRLRGGRLEIRGEAANGRLSLTIADDGPGISDAELGSGERVGLRNTRARLAHLYGRAGHLELRNRPGGGLAVTVHLPLHARPLVTA
jgi:signal transduction histidine kinase